MILVDSAIWIDLFHNRATAQVARLADLIPRSQVLLGDLIVAEVLQGIRDDREFNETLAMFGRFKTITIAGNAIAVRAARNYRRLRTLGITPCKTIDTLIATRCIADGIELLYSDRDFDPFVEHLGLRSALQ